MQSSLRKHPVSKFPHGATIPGKWERKWKMAPGLKWPKNGCRSGKMDFCAGPVPNSVDGHCRRKCRQSKTTAEAKYYGFQCRSIFSMEESFGQAGYHHIRNCCLSNSKTFQDGNGNGNFWKLIQMTFKMVIGNQWK